jgi:hypothetical protein
MTLLELCVRNAGGRVRDIRRGARVCEFLLEWAAVTVELGEPITSEQFADAWGVDVRTVERRRREFRELFPGHTPQDVVAELLRELERRGGELEPSLRVPAALAA